MTRNSDKDGSTGSLSKPCYVNRVPDEILLEVFLTLRDWSFDRWTKAYGNKWIVVTHICRFWRNVKLWSFLDLSNHSACYFKTVLERSKVAPLTIDNERRCRRPVNRTWWGEIEGCRVCAKTIENGLLQLPRIRRINLVNINFKKDLDAAFDTPAPLLEKLTMSALEDDDEFYPLLSDHFLAKSAPSLHFVNLKGCLFTSEMRTLLFKNLTVLIMGDYYRQLNHYLYMACLYPDVEELVQIFRACPNLGEFLIDIVRGLRPDVKFDPSCHEDSQETITLSDMGNFTVRELDGHAAEHLFHYVKIPNFCELTLGIRCETDSQIRTIAPVLESLCVGHIYDDLRMVFRKHSTSLDTFTSEDPGQEQRHIQLILYQIDITTGIIVNPPHLKVMCLLAMLIHCGIWKKLTHLSLNPGPSFSIDPWMWALLFRSKPNLPELRLEFVDEACHHLACAAAINNILMALTPDANANEVVLPALKGVTVAYGDLRLVRQKLMLSRFLLNRSRFGHRLSFLHFKECNGRDEWKSWESQALPFVEDIYWYGTYDNWLREQRELGCIEKLDLYTMY